MFSQLAPGSFALDLRTADRTPPVRALLREPWLMQIHAWFQPIVPREATDVFVYFDQVTPSRPRRETP